MWWDKELKGRQLGVAVLETLSGLEQAQHARLQDYVIFAGLYGNAEMSGFTPYNYALASIRSRYDKIAVNLIHNMVDTVVARLVAPRIKPTFLTSKGDWVLQRKAKKMDDAVQGIMYENDFMFLDSQVIKDAAIFGNGYLKVIPDEDGDGVCYERVLPSEIFVDHAEALYGNPQNMYQVRWVSKNVLIAQFPEFKQEILDAEEEKEATFVIRELSNVVKVCEAWHLGEEGGGRHVIALNGVALVDEKYDDECFPFAVYQWNPRVAGFYGEGLAEQLVPLQVELNKLLRRVQNAQHLMSVPYFLVERGSKINPSSLNNSVAHIVEHTGKPPIPVVGQAMHPEVYQHIDRIIQWAYEIAGISQMSAQSKKPVGLDSAPALRTFHDIESQRFQLVGEMHERFVLQVAKLTVEAAQKIKNFKVKGVNKKFFQEFSWKDISLEDSQYVLKIYPTSMLATQPAAKLQQVGEMFQQGMLAPIEAMKLLDFPDVEAALAQKTAQIDLVHDQLASMADGGKYVAPEPFQDLQLCLEEATSFYIQLKLAKAPEETLVMIRRFIRACDDKLSTIAQAAQGVNTNVQSAGTALGAPSIPTLNPGAAPGVPAPGPVPGGPGTPPQG